MRNVEMDRKKTSSRNPLEGKNMRNVAIFVFDDVEVLDFAGPFEVFGVAGGIEPLYNVFTVAEFARPVLARNNLSINPAFTFDTMPDADVLVLPGGAGTRREKHKPNTLRFIRDRVGAAQNVISVCSGALTLAKAGLLRDLHATTHRGALAELAQDAPSCTVLPDARVVDNGKIIVSAGISMGIDASLYTIAKHHGHAKAFATANYMEYDWVHQFVDGQRIVCTSPKSFDEAY